MFKSHFVFGNTLKSPILDLTTEFRNFPPPYNLCMGFSTENITCTVHVWTFEGRMIEDFKIQNVDNETCPYLQFQCVPNSKSRQIQKNIETPRVGSMAQALTQHSFGLLKNNNFFRGLKIVDFQFSFWAWMGLIWDISDHASGRFTWNSGARIFVCVQKIKKNLKIQILVEKKEPRFSGNILKRNKIAPK